MFRPSSAVPDIQLLQSEEKQPTRQNNAAEKTEHLSLGRPKILISLSVHEADCSGKEEYAAYDDQPLLHSLQPCLRSKVVMQ